MSREHYLRWSPYWRQMDEEGRAERMLASAEAKKSDDIWKIYVEERLAELESRVGEQGARLPKSASEMI